MQVDFFVSYTSSDKNWAEWIAWILEGQGLSVKLQAWDFVPGCNFVMEMHRAVTESKCTIALLSPLYMKCSFGASEWAAVFATDPESFERRFIPVRIQQCDIHGLLKPIVYIDLVGVGESEAERRLLNGLSGQRTKPTLKPEFPGSQTPAARKGRPEFPQRYEVASVNNTAATIRHVSHKSSRFDSVPIFDDRPVSRWVRYDEAITEGLAELGLGEPQPHSNEDSVFRIEGEPLVTPTVSEIDGRDVRIGVNSVVILFESNSYAVRPESLISRRCDVATIKTVVGGVQFSTPDRKGHLDGPLWKSDYFAVIESRDAGNGAIHLQLRAARRSFVVTEVDARGRRKSVETTEEQDAVLNILLGQNQDKDSLGRISLAKVNMRRVLK